MGSIAGLRKELDETQTEFGRRLGVTMAAVSHYEHRRRRPQWVIAQRIKRAAERAESEISWEEIMGAKP